MTIPGPKIAYTDTVTPNCVCWPWSKICVTGRGPEFAFTVLFVVVVVAVILAEVVISLEHIITISIHQF